MRQKGSGRGDDWQAEVKSDLCGVLLRPVHLRLDLPHLIKPQALRSALHPCQFHLFPPPELMSELDLSGQRGIASRHQRTLTLCSRGQDLLRDRSPPKPVSDKG